MLSTLGWMVTVWWQGPELVSSSTYTGGLGYVPSYSPHLRRSLPNMIAPHSNEPPKIYPYHLLLITNYRLPADVDRCNLEVNTSPLFSCTVLPTGETSHPHAVSNTASLFAAHRHICTTQILYSDKIYWVLTLSYTIPCYLSQVFSAFNIKITAVWSLFFKVINILANFKSINKYT